MSTIAPNPTKKEKTNGAKIGLKFKPDLFAFIISPKAAFRRNQMGLCNMRKVFALTENLMAMSPLL
jgi:hypothetical protein